MRNFGPCRLKFLLGCVGVSARGRQLHSQIHRGFAQIFICKGTNGLHLAGGVVRMGGGVRKTPLPPSRQAQGEDLSRAGALSSVWAWAEALSQLCPYIWLWNVLWFNGLVSSHSLPKSWIPPICFKSKQSMTADTVPCMSACRQLGEHLNQINPELLNYSLRKMRETSSSD